MHIAGYSKADMMHLLVSLYLKALQSFLEIRWLFLATYILHASQTLGKQLNFTFSKTLSSFLTSFVPVDDEI